IYCTVDSILFSSKPVGEPVVVLHRFGGSYGEAKFLLTAVQEEEESIKVTLENRWGVPIKVINLDGVKVHQTIVPLSEKILNYTTKSVASREITEEKKTDHRSAGDPTVQRLIHLYLKEVQDGYVELRYFVDHPNQYERRSLPLTEI
ncbi:MAG: hypothetical protein ACYTX0_50100, partial [Nostoc sp.]